MTHRNFVAHQLPALGKHATAESFVHRILEDLSIQCTALAVTAACHGVMVSEPAEKDHERKRRQLSVVVGSVMCLRLTQTFSVV